MVLLGLSIMWALVVAGLLARAITQYRHYQIVRAGPGPAGPLGPAVSVVVPARNEERIIGNCIAGLMRQDYPPGRLHIIVNDDNSTDRTFAIVAELAARDDRVRLIKGELLPEGWLGKPHACWRAAGQAVGEWLCFIDADTIAEPPLIATAVQKAMSDGLDLLSLQPFQELGTFAERLILPAGFFLIAFTQDLRRTNDPASPEASVNGQFLLIRRSVYESVGGHAAVRDAVAEDSALARVIKSSGHRIGCFGAEGLLHTRMYSDFLSLWEGAARQAASLLPSAAILLCVAIAAFLLALASVALPAWAACCLAWSPDALAIVACALAGAGSIAMLGTHIGAARYFRIPFWYGLLFPLGYVVGSGVVVYAAWQRLHRRTRWKGRTYPALSRADTGLIPGSANEAAPHEPG